MTINQQNPAAVHQPPPRAGEEIVLNLVIKDLQDRAEVGLKKYGTYLKTQNGRDALMDAYQEALDLAMYLRQAIEERGASSTDNIAGNAVMILMRDCQLATFRGQEAKQIIKEAIDAGRKLDAKS